MAPPKTSRRPEQGFDPTLKPAQPPPDPPLVLKANGEPVRSSTDAARPLTSARRLPVQWGLSQRTLPSRYSVGNGVCIDIDAEDGLETHYLGDDRFDCVRCGKHTTHTMFIEIGGVTEVIRMQAFKVCCDCHLETKGEIVNVGRMEGFASASATARAFQTVKPRRKVRKGR